MEKETIENLMRIAIYEGKKSVSEDGKLSPKVGATIIMNGEVLGSSFRGQLGEGDHAEYTLFEKILNGKDVKGATLFTTLEPCTNRNNHKPCSDWIIEKGISHVYIGILDPNPKIYNNGCKKLRDAGLDVSYFPIDLRNEILNDNLAFVKQFDANPSLSGRATFDYTNKNGLFVIGNNEMIFETKWSPGSNGSIHAYNDPGTIKNIAIADGNKEINEIKDSTIYNSTSRTRLVSTGEILVLENINGYKASVKILGIKYKNVGNGINELDFEYKILADKSSDFTN